MVEGASGAERNSDGEDVWSKNNHVEEMTIPYSDLKEAIPRENICNKLAQILAECRTLVPSSTCEFTKLSISSNEFWFLRGISASVKEHEVLFSASKKFHPLGKGKFLRVTASASKIDTSKFSLKTTIEHRKIECSSNARAGAQSTRLKTIIQLIKLNYHGRIEIARENHNENYTTIKFIERESEDLRYDNRKNHNENYTTIKFIERESEDDLRYDNHTGCAWKTRKHLMGLSLQMNSILPQTPFVRNGRVQIPVFQIGPGCLVKGCLRALLIMSDLVTSRNLSEEDEEPVDRATLGYKRARVRNARQDKKCASGCKTPSQGKMLVRAKNTCPGKNMRPYGEYALRRRAYSQAQTARPGGEPAPVRRTRIELMSSIRINKNDREAKKETNHKIKKHVIYPEACSHDEAQQGLSMEKFLQLQLRSQNLNLHGEGLGCMGRVPWCDRLPAGYGSWVRWPCEQPSDRRGRIIKDPEEEKEETVNRL
ncbi:hypothetical protein KSP40_PGU010711 [Platanthera guangdongensis]|uniref:Uncharacterized protein n=1 Tax=Platanthera guangdongensis TaxID=2320717 RepID=A0ABR2MGJ0_9ASPA